MRPTPACLCVGFALLTAAGPAYAHAPVPGIEGFYIGLLHPFSTPAQALVLIGAGMLVGGMVVEKVRWFFVTFPLALFAGLFLGSATLDVDGAMYMVAVLACSLAALMPGRLVPLAIVITAVAGALIGSASIPDAGPVRDRVFTMAGSVVGANIGLLYLWGAIHFITQRFTWDWVRIALRVVAAWMGAIALVMLALGFAESPVAA